MTRARDPIRFNVAVRTKADDGPALHLPSAMAALSTAGRVAAAALCLCGAGPAAAEFRYDTASQSTRAYIEANVLAIFYHELGHALIDVMQLPIFGQEEDAADVLSVLLIDAFFEEEPAVEIAYATASSFLIDDAARQKTGGDVAFYDVHAPDLQRYYTLVCLFYGASPDAREFMAEELELPEARADGCPDEYDLAWSSWGPVMDEIADDSGTGDIVMRVSGPPTDAADLTRAVIGAEIDALNAQFRLPAPLEVTIEPCGTVNAFYDPEYRQITMCTEFTDYLAQTAF